MVTRSLSIELYTTAPQSNNPPSNPAILIMASGARSRLSGTLRPSTSFISEEIYRGEPSG